MNLQRSQNQNHTKNQLDFCVLVMNSWKNNTIYNNIKTKYSETNFTKCVFMQDSENMKKSITQRLSYS